MYWLILAKYMMDVGLLDVVLLDVTLHSPLEYLISCADVQ